MVEYTAVIMEDLGLNIEDDLTVRHTDRRNIVS